MNLLYGIPLPLKVGYILALDLLLALSFFAAALLLLYYKPRSFFSLFLALTLVLVGATETDMTDALINPRFNPAAALWHWPVLGLRALGAMMGLILFYIFPDGRFVPRWTLVLAIVWSVLVTLWLIRPPAKVT